MSTHLVPPVTPERGAVDELASDSGMNPVNLSAWRAGWQLDGGFLCYSSERRCLTSV